VRRKNFLVGFLLLLASTVDPAVSQAQLSLSPVSPRGQTVTPVFEGWYRNPDSTFSLSFGYFNRNGVEIIDVPVGADNSIAPGGANQGQPTHFHSRRHWGVFAVTVPADFGEQKVVWTLRNRGQAFSIAGSLHRDWQIDALEGEASSDNTPPALSFQPGGPEARGPLGVTVGPWSVAAGQPLTLTVTVRDDGKSGSLVRAGVPVDIAWFKHQGPGDVTFSAPTARLTPTGGTATTTATFGAAGDYIVRVRANDSPVASAGHSQCCWTNGFVRVTVTR
jgi:hypothetical protein